MYHLHTPASPGHLDGLKDRLNGYLQFAPYHPYYDSAEHTLIRKLAAVAERTDQGQLVSRDVEAVVACQTILEFSFRPGLTKWWRKGSASPRLGGLLPKHEKS